MKAENGRKRFVLRYYQYNGSTPETSRRWPYRKAKLQELLGQLQPDILCVQEGTGKFMMPLAFCVSARASFCRHPRSMGQRQTHAFRTPVAL